MNEKIMIVEDDTATRRMLEFVLREHGYQLFGFENGSVALEATETLLPDLAIVDLVMPLLDGIELSRRLRAQARFDRMPIVAVTVRDHAVDRYEAYRAGMNDFMTKPVDPLELTFRVRAFLRLVSKQTFTNAPLGLIEVGDITLDASRFLAQVRGVDVPLTRLETSILHFLMLRPGLVFSAVELAEGVQGDSGRRVDAAHAHIRNLRNKLELDPRQPRYLITSGRKGYYYAP